MLNVNELIIKTIKKQIFVNENKNKAARQVLSELKTAFVDVREDITAEIQNKILKKMKSSREKAISIYEQANAVDKINQEKEELLVICELMGTLEQFLPKMMTEAEIRNKIQEIIDSKPDVKIGDIMREFKTINADKALVSTITKEMIEVKK